jgi:acyl-CoA dehydrogenase
MTTLIVVSALALAGFLLFIGRAYWAWVLPAALVLGAWWLRATPSPWLFWPVAGPIIGVAVVFGLAPLRRVLVTPKVLKLMKPLFPPMSATERTALEAGTVWWDADLFGGKPRWQRLLDFQPPGLTPRERSFLENETEQLCRLVDGEEVDRSGDLSEATWDHLKNAGFMGLIIPEKYGGLGFSAEANSAVVTKVSSHNVTLAVTVMVPNSLGPAELLLHYGTEEQKDYFLPRLAKGIDIPAFALTEPGAGSDAGGMTSTGVICRDEWEGEQVLGLRLNWNKRYITLASEASLLGLAFKAKDPDHLLGDVEDYGITCALVPTSLPGVVHDKRHDPLGVKFLNGPTTGEDVFIPLSLVIGEREGLGQGWRMLMDCLSAGRSISLPGLACGGTQVATRVISSYAQIREQFGMPIARFEGIEEKLAEIFGRTWSMDATRRITASAVAAGHKPSVISAIAKAYLTEGMRTVINDAMDVQGGAGICRGPRNVLAPIYQGAPIGITVEGANILTRTLIVFGQGALRCHPWAFAEMEAARRDDVKEFDRTFFKHVGHMFSTLGRASLLAVSGGRLVGVPIDGPGAAHLRNFSRLSAAFALCAEGAMATLGGALKRKERLTGRLADALAWLYMGSCAVKRFEDMGRPAADVPLLEWTCRQAAWEIETALAAFLDNLPSRATARVLRPVIFPFGARARRPSDHLGAKVVRGVLEDADLRDRMTEGIHMPSSDKPGLGAFEAGLAKLRAAQPLRSKLKAAVRAGTLPRMGTAALLDHAVEHGVLTGEERTVLRDFLETQWDLVQVDAYEAQTYAARSAGS